MTAVPAVSDKTVRQQYAEVGIRQADDPVLRSDARPLTLPAERALARGTIRALEGTLQSLRYLHRFRNGVGIAAPQIGVSLSVALVRSPRQLPITLVNPDVTDVANEETIDFEGCLSFFDVRGLVPRPVWVDVVYCDLTGQRIWQRFEESTARLVLHEIDHLKGRLYVDRIERADDIVDLAEYARRRG